MIGSALLARIAAVACLAMAVAASWQWYRAERAERELDRRDRAAAEEVQRQVTAARAEERRRTLKMQEVLDAEVIARKAVENDARGAAGAAERLRQRAAQLAASCAARNPAAAPGGASAPAAADLLADMLGRVAAAAGELGSYADRARLAGQTCERAYDGLTR